MAANGASHDAASRQNGEQYEVSHTILFDPKERPVKVIIIGAGVSGIMMSYKLSTQCENVQHTVYDRNPDIGGTWYENRYPGCACDTPSHGYAFPWAPNPNWTKLFSTSTEIHAYLKDVARICDLNKNINLNCQIAGAWWDGDAGKWKLKIQRVEPKIDRTSLKPLKVVDEFWDECDVLCQATGTLNRWKYPDLPGLEKFKGRLMHSAGWPDDYTENEWRDTKIAVIGSGASSIQVVPNMQPTVKHIDLFVRSPVWFLNTEIFGDLRTYPPEMREEFRNDRAKLIAYIKEREQWFNKRFPACIMGTPEQKAFKERLTTRMREYLEDDRLVNGFTPSFPVNCRRLTPGDPYMDAVRKPNVDVHFTAAAEVYEHGIIGQDGSKCEVDAIICATGFDLSYIPKFPIVGKDGVSLERKWTPYPKAYFGVACAGMPNWLTFMGPNWPLAGGSAMAALDANGDWAIKFIKKLQKDRIKSMHPRQDVSDEYNEHTQKWSKHVVFGQDCNSWYKDRKTGYLKSIYAGSSIHYAEILSEPRWEDMDIDYLNKHNRFAFMGIGLHKAQTPEGISQGLELAPHIREDRIDPRILREMHGQSVEQ